MVRVMIYEKLWGRLKRRNLKKKELAKIAKINPSTISKLAKNKYVSTEVLEKICRALDCDIEEIVQAKKG